MFGSIEDYLAILCFPHPKKQTLTRDVFLLIDVKKEDGGTGTGSVSRSKQSQEEHRQLKSLITQLAERLGRQ